jgi:nucleotide-binding universal stress UspA family protein
MEVLMKADTERPKPSRIVLVVGVDLSDASEHLLAQTRALIGPVDDAETHVVHVVHRDSLTKRLAHPIHSEDIGARAQVQYANWELQRLCFELVKCPRNRVFLHIPVGDSAADELTRVAAEVGADILVVEAREHDPRGPRRVLHRSSVARIARTAPCTVLTIRKRARPVSEREKAPEPPLTTSWSASP